MAGKEECWQEIPKTLNWERGQVLKMWRPGAWGDVLNDRSTSEQLNGAMLHQPFSLDGLLWHSAPEKARGLVMSHLGCKDRKLDCITASEYCIGSLGSDGERGIGAGGWGGGGGCVCVGGVSPFGSGHFTSWLPLARQLPPTPCPRRQAMNPSRTACHALPAFCACCKWLSVT